MRSDSHRLKKKKRRGRGPTEERNGGGMHDAAAVDRGVHGRRDEPGVLECLEHRRHPRRQMPCVHVHERIAHRLPDPCRAQRAEGRSVLDEAPFSAVVHDEVRNPMDPGLCPVAIEDRQTGVSEGKTETARRYAPCSISLAKVGASPSPRMPLERRRAQPVDDHDDELGSSSHHELRCRGSPGRREARTQGAPILAIWVRPRTLHHTVQRRSGDTRTHRETSPLFTSPAYATPRAASAPVAGREAPAREERRP